MNTVSLVTLDVRGASLQNVLDLISAQTGLSFKRTDKTISVSKGKEIKNSRSKNGNITGIVRDHAGEPVIGASIQIKGTTLGTITDYNGQFSLNDVPTDGVLTVSYIGFNTEDIPVNHQKNLQIVMRENAEQLEEVVVVAYGTAKKVHLQDRRKLLSKIVLKNGWWQMFLKPWKVRSQVCRAHREVDNRVRELL